VPDIEDRFAELLQTVSQLLAEVEQDHAARLLDRAPNIRPRIAHARPQ